MGLNPRVVDQMSFGEIAAAVRGFNEANGGGNRAPTDDEFEAALAALPD